MIKDGKNREQVEHEKRRLEKLYERRHWAEYQRTYERCKAIAQAVWDDDIRRAQAWQRDLAEEMRDRRVDITFAAPGRTDAPAEIPVPLFTPRDRLQFLKEATASLFIGTEKRGLTVTPEVKDVEAQETNEPGPGIPEAASGADETQPDTALTQTNGPGYPRYGAQDYGEPVFKTPTSGV